MIKLETFLRFFRDLFSKHFDDSEVEEDEFKLAIQTINYAYNPQVMAASEQRVQVDYRKIVYRCAYIHKYGALHAALVQSALLKYNEALKTTIPQNRSSVRICCLGGGPGIDVVGVAAALGSLGVSRNKRCRFITVDSNPGWFSSHKCIFNVATRKRHGILGKILDNRVSSCFVRDDMLNPKKETMRAINYADLLTMIKFVSAVDPDPASLMLKNVFAHMKPGALVLFIDNSGGGSYEITENAATACGLEEISDSCRNVKYGAPVFHSKVFGESSRSYVNVAIKMWKKPEIATRGSACVETALPYDHA